MCRYTNVTFVCVHVCVSVCMRYCVCVCTCVCVSVAYACISIIIYVQCMHVCAYVCLPEQLQLCICTETMQEYYRISTLNIIKQLSWNEQSQIKLGNCLSTFYHSVLVVWSYYMYV